MSKIKQRVQKAKQNRDRVTFHRRWRSILKTKRSVNYSDNRQNHNVHQDDSSRKHEANKSLGARECLRRWALKYNISKIAVTDLLKVLKSLGMNYLPSDSRTLLHTPRQMEISHLSNGQLWYAFLEMICFNTDFALK